MKHLLDILQITALAFIFLAIVTGLYTILIPLGLWAIFLYIGLVLLTIFGIIKLIEHAR